MNLIDDIISRLEDYRVGDVRTCVHWTAVVSRNCGLAYTYRREHIDKVRGIGDLTNKTAIELAEYAKSWNLMEASIGVAAINSLIEPKGKKQNAVDFVLEEGKGKRIAVVGHFPFIDKVRAVAEIVWVMEKYNPYPGDLPDTAAEYILPKADITLITGATLPNKSMQRLLELSKGFTIVMGPSTPMSDVLFDYGADMLAGIKVVDKEKILRCISEGGTHISELQGYELVVMRKE